MRKQSKPVSVHLHFPMAVAEKRDAHAHAVMYATAD